jgi:hypothetical protein
MITDSICTRSNPKNVKLCFYFQFGFFCAYQTDHSKRDSSSIAPCNQVVRSPREYACVCCSQSTHIFAPAKVQRLTHVDRKMTFEKILKIQTPDTFYYDFFYFLFDKKYTSLILLKWDNHYMLLIFI